MFSKIKTLMAVTLVMISLMLIVAGPAGAHTARRMTTTGGSAGNSTIETWSTAKAWISDGGWAKGHWRDHNNYKLDVVLRDTGLDHHNTLNNRPGSYYGIADPLYLTRAIQYSLYYMGYTPIAIDNIWGPQTASRVGDFQYWNGLGVDGIVGTGTYDKMSWWGAAQF